MNNQKPYTQVQEVITIYMTNLESLDEDFEELEHFDKTALKEECIKLWHDPDVVYHHFFQSPEFEYLREEHQDRDKIDYDTLERCYHYPQCEHIARKVVMKCCWFEILHEQQEPIMNNPASDAVIAASWGFKNCPGWQYEYVIRSTLEDAHTLGGYRPTQWDEQGQVVAYEQLEDVFIASMREFKALRNRPEDLQEIYAKGTFFSDGYRFYGSKDYAFEFEYYLFQHPEKMYEMVPPWHPWYGPEHNEMIRDYILDNFWMTICLDHEDPRK